MAEFFQPGKRSRCLFTPELWCDSFDYKNETMGLAFFLCDIESETVCAILRNVSREGVGPETVIHETIKRAWGDRRVGFRYWPGGPEAWTEQQPCQDCQLVRKAQVVIIDLNDRSARGTTFLGLAVLSSMAAQGVQGWGTVSPLPMKKMIIVNDEDAEMPAHYKIEFDFVAYPDVLNLPVLDGFFRNMLRLAREFSRILTQEDIITLPELSQGNSGGQLSGGGTVASEDAIEDISIRIIDTEDDAQPPSLGSVADEREIRKTIMQEVGLSEVLDLKGILGPELSRAERMMYRKEYVIAVRSFHKARTQHSQPYEVQEYIKLCLATCAERLRLFELVRVFFYVADKNMEERFKIDEFQASNGFQKSFIEICDDVLWERLNPGSLDKVPICVYGKLSNEDLDKTYAEFQPSSNRTVFILAEEYVDRIQIENSRIRYRDESEPQLYIIELMAENLKRHITEGDEGYNYIRDQVDKVYGRVSSPYLAVEPVSKGHEFFGRQKLIRQVTEKIRHSRKFYIVGRICSGKTSLLYRLKELAELKNCLLIHIEMPSNLPIGAHYLEIVRSVRSCLQGRYPKIQYPYETYPVFDLTRLPSFGFDQDTPESIWKDQLVNDLMSLASNLVEIKELECSKMVLLLDEIDCVLSTDANKSFLQFMRALGPPKNPYVSLGVTSLGKFIHEATNADSPTHNQFTGFLMGMLTREESKELIETIGHNNSLYYNTESIDDIYGASGGDPLIARLLCNLIFEKLDGRGGIVTHEHVLDCTQAFVEQYKRQIHDIYSLFLSEHFKDEAEVLKEIAISIEVGELVQSGFLERVLGEKSWDHTRRRNAIDNLLKLELLEKVTSTGKYRIKIGLLHHILRQEQLGIA